MITLLALYCSQCPQAAGGKTPEHLKYYFSCIRACDVDYNKCVRDCEKNNTCEASRQFCKSLCRKIDAVCVRKCRDETVRRYHIEPSPYW